MTDFKIEYNSKDALKYNETLSSIMIIIKSLEEEFKKDTSFYFKEKTIIDSIFSLLNFLLSVIQQLTELIEKQDIKNINNNIIDNLLNFTKELLSQKIKQIIFINNNNYIHNYNINGYQDANYNYNINTFNDCNTLQKTHDDFFHENFDQNLAYSPFLRSKSNKTICQRKTGGSSKNNVSKKIKNTESQKLFYISEKNSDNLNNENPITKVKNIIKNAKNYSSSVDYNINNNGLMTERRIITKMKKLSKNKKENNIHHNGSLTHRKIISVYTICPLKSPKNEKKVSKDNNGNTISKNIFREGKEKEGREAKEILFDCMNNIKKKLRYNEKEKKKKTVCQITLNSQSRRNLMPYSNKKK